MPRRAGSSRKERSRRYLAPRENRRRIEPYARLYNFVVLGQIVSPRAPPSTPDRTAAYYLSQALTRSPVIVALLALALFWPWIRTSSPSRASRSPSTAAGYCVPHSASALAGRQALPA